MNGAWTEKSVNIFSSVNRFNPKIKAALFGVFFLAYWLVYPLVIQSQGWLVYRLFAPVGAMLAAMLWGVRAGVVITVLSVALGYLSYRVVGLEYQGGGLAMILGLLSAAAIGWLRDLNLWLDQELSRTRVLQQQKEQLVHNLEQALEEIKTLRGLICICCHCKRIRDEQGDWLPVEEYVEEHTHAAFSHGLCPECLEKHYPKEEEEEEILG